ncbi:hydroxyacid dehydrogenase [Phreatobacter stygius]|uniref:Hydroxyacid dehydrogenase n=1 Tax=Phreatobacter stygius TaxID=1940610 RepID=A0A4D7B8Q3_9HYPH|nr:hydroxyacid dehydrogenase [Phreatobacter stygius]QCI66638.1 hydroxyacid dehydrogenase [Phreatobacter stygius]
MTDIVICEFMDEAAVADLRRDFSVTYDKALVDRPAELTALVAGARALVVRNRTQVRGALLEAGAQLEAIGRLGVGLDNIDLAACKARGIAVLPATGANDIAVAEWALTTVLVLLRGAYAASAEVADGLWPRERLMGREVHGKTLGLIGFGAIARETALRARAFGMTIVAADPFVAADDPAWAAIGARKVDLDQLMTSADAISLHVPLTDETRNLIDAKRLAAMKPGAVIVNAARGGVIDEPALAAALKAGTLAGAALDVFDQEPLKAGSPLNGAPNLILTPHIAGVTVESNVRVSSVTAANIRTVLGERRP